jgi:hypothetical protein
MNRRKKMVILIVAAAALLAAGAAASLYAQTPVPAAEVAGSTQTSESKNTTIYVSRNVYSSGSVARPSAAVEGDFVGFGGRVIVDQFVKGDALLAGGSVRVQAPIGDDLRVAGGEVTLESAIGGELFATAGSILVDKAARIATASTLYAGDVTIAGTLDGPLKVSAKKILINGTVNGDARLRAEQIELGPTAVINGALSYTVSGELKRDAAAIVGGAITREPGKLRNWDWDDEHERGWDRHMGGRNPARLGSVFGYFALLACSTIFLLVFPNYSERASARIVASPWSVIGMGVVSVLGFPVLALLLLVTILGIPLGLLVLGMIPVLLLMGYVVGILFLSRRAQSVILKGKPVSFAMNIGFLALMLLLVMLLSRIPFVGFLAVLVLTLAGTGACVSELLTKNRSGSNPPPPALALQSA